MDKKPKLNKAQLENKREIEAYRKKANREYKEYLAKRKIEIETGAWK